MTGIIQMFQDLEAAAQAASHRDMDGKFDAMADTGYCPLDICRFVMAQSKPEQRRINFVRVVGYFFHDLTVREFEEIFYLAMNLDVNPYSFLFAIRDGELPRHIPRPFQIRHRLCRSFHRDPGSPALPWIDTGLLLGGFPPNLIFPWGIEFFRCHSMTEIGDGLEAGGPIRIRHCRRLESVPGRLTAHRGLEVTDSPEIRTLRSKITVHGDFTLKRLPSLYRHGIGIHVDGTLRIQRCPNLTRLKPGISAGHLDIRFDQRWLLRHATPHLHTTGGL